MKTSRRGFLGLLAGIAATPVLAPLSKLLPPTKTYIAGKDAVINATIGSYADYINISDIAFDSAIDPQVELLTTYYTKSVMRNLRANTPLQSALVFKPVPANTGNTIKFYNYDLEGYDRTRSV